MSLPKYIVKHIIVPESTRLVNNATKLLTKKLESQSASWGKVKTINSADGLVTVEMTDGTTQTARIGSVPIGIKSPVLIKNGVVLSG